MTRFIASLLGATLLASGIGQTARAGAPPELYVYEGAGSTGLAALPKFENMLGRKVDGVVDFNDYGKAPPDAVANLNWQLGAWQGHGRKLAISIGLAFRGLSTADIAAGKGDAMFQQMGVSLVRHGFGSAVIRLGWEMNGGWYGWGQKGPVFAAAYTRAAGVLKATPGSSFTLVWNPTAGLDPSSEMPAGAAGIDQMGQDLYANSWNSGGCQSEPCLFNGDWNGYWGGVSFVRGPRAYHGGRPAGSSVPEFGAGSRGDGHGACPSTSGATNPPNWAACDDPVFIAQALQAFAAAGVKWVGYWDYNAGDYNSQVSNGARPGQALELLKVYGGGDLPTLLAGSRLYTGDAFKAAPPKGYHAILVQLANGHVEQIAWGEAAGQTQQLTDLTARTPAAPD